MGSGISYPFAKYSFIILPGFQYGGMEHTGATLYNDTRMFLSEHPTLDEELARAKLIAHETAHMWFGIDLSQETYALTVPLDTKAILPNTDERGYGLFIPDEQSRTWLLAHWQEITDDTARQSLLMLLYENYQHRIITDKEKYNVLATSSSPRIG